MNENNARKNLEGYSDSTAYEATRIPDVEYRRFKKLLKIIFELCDVAGYRLEGRITLVDKRNGRVWK